MTPNNYLIFYENDFHPNSSDRPLFKIKISDDNIFIKGINLKSVSIISDKKNRGLIDITNEIKGNITGDFTLFFDDLNKYQRILKIKKYTT